MSIKSIVGTIVLFISLPINAVLLTPGDTINFDYDFSLDSALGPFTGSNWGLYFNDNDLWESGDSVRFDYYDSADVLIGTAVQSQIFPIDISNITSGDLFFAPITDKIGTVALTSIDSSFNLDEFAFRLSGNGSTAFEVFNVSSVPVPAAVWLFGSGLLGLIGIARRKKA